MAVKTDMSKAYDRLEWDFISLVLLRLGFHQNLVDCIMQCISSVTYSFLINGLPRGKVVPSRGIRQGDPLSPYIFILCSEVLSGLCNRAQEDGSLQGLRVARASPRVNHLLFADATMFFLDSNRGNCAALRDILSKYEEASGQAINKDKSAITFSRRTPEATKLMVKEELYNPRLLDSGGIITRTRRKWRGFLGHQWRHLRPSVAWGVRDFQTFNIALLAKTGWRLLQNPNCLISRVLMGKYSPDSNILLATGSSDMSHGWRSVLLGRDLLIKNLGWLVGDGKSIQVWQDPWLSATTQERPMGPANELQLQLRVSDLMLQGTCDWDEEKILQCVPEYVEKIQCLKPSNTGAPDKLIWLGTKTGVYSNKSGYYSEVDKMLNGDVGLGGRAFNWKKNVWELECAPKIKTFAWKLLKGALPVGERLTDRHIPVDPSCKRCGASESITHLFFQCPYARKARNKFVFEGFSCSPEDTLSLALQMARELETKQSKEPVRKQMRSLNQIQPPPGFTVVRSDAVWSPTGTMAGLGWVVLSPSGHRPFHKRTTFVSSALVAEGLALLEAVRSSVRDKLTTVVFETDSAQMIKALSPGNCRPELYGVVADILSLSASFDFISFRWIGREHNIQVDALAKYVLNVAGSSVVDEVIVTSN
ncbi:uncharacterized protein LOC108858408 [Raphanus sativus]|uniref:Uncharacterized protein LOC108858408 n=1 Tax=Raphanus sativus TaxID=3726 RepID=A0A6J0NVQ5_RAPSA|nr:uncharacterized protein LOC108858408 [Raphanus sativus]